MSSNDSGRPPPHQVRRRVLRKIAPRSEPPGSMPPDQPSAAPEARASTPRRTDASDPFDLLANPDRSSSALNRMLEKSDPSLHPPPAVSSSPHAIPSAGKLPSFDTPAPGTPAPSRARGSLPPVVASVSSRPAVGHDAPPPATSVRKAGVVGAALGLAFVAMFVVGARLAYRPAPPVTATSTPPKAASVPASASTGWQPVPTNTMPAPGPTELTVVIQSPRRVGPPPRPTPVPSRIAVVPATTVPEGAMPGPAGSVTPGRSATSASSSSGEPAENANPLVPVIPSASPPELDPLVKAVLEEDQPARK